MNNAHEGYVKYTAEHTPGPPVDVCNVPHWAELNDARTRLYKLGLVGINSNGIGFGNVSVRSGGGGEFIISGTATGALPYLTPAEYCLVTACDISHNSVVSTGPVQPSSESMTHGAVYHNAGVHCVIHIHSRKIFDGMIRDRYPATPESASYGTPEIAVAIGECITGDEGVHTEGIHTEGMIVLEGHDEGVIVYGPSPERAFNLIMELYNKYGG